MARRTEPAELIPRGVRLAIVETLAARYFTPDIDRLFGSEGWELDRSALFRFGESPHGRAEAFDAAVDSTSPEDAAAYLAVVGHVVARLTQEEAEASWENQKAPPRAGREYIERELRRAGFEPGDDGIWHLPLRVEPSAALLEVGMRTGIGRVMAAMRRSDCDPEERIGLAKELVEATIKYALNELDEPYGKKDDIPALSRKLHVRLGLDPKVSLAPDPEGEATARRLLSGLTEIPHNLAELRNPYGSGHGRAERIAGITHLAELAARAADAYATFILGVLDEQAAP